MTEDEWYVEYKYLEALIDKQKALLARAADALHWDNPLDHAELIAELRKAAAE
jgi:hypothetical protein